VLAAFGDSALAVAEVLACFGEEAVTMELRTSSRTLSAFILTLVLLGALCSSCSSGKSTATPIPTLDAEAIKQAAVATLVARMSAATPTVAASATSSAGDALKKLPTDTPLPTFTPEPTPVPTPVVSVSIDLLNMHYEAWGSPVNNACQQFDDSHPMRKFQLEITIYNGSRQKITEWYPDFYTSGGRLVTTCFYGIGNLKGFPEVPAGEKRTITFAAFAENSEYIKSMKMVVLGLELRRCFGTSGALVGCP
jgi:hypothetical protein